MRVTGRASTCFFDCDGYRDLYGEAADCLLLEIVAPLFAECSERGWVEHCFFIRYSEDGPHLRLRFKGPGSTRERIEPLLLQHLDQRATTDVAVVHRLAWIAYQPELERYGGALGVGLAERLFHHSSQAAIALLRKVPSGDRAARLGKAMLAMLVLLYTFVPAETGSQTSDPAARAVDRRAAASDLARRYSRGYLTTMAPDPVLRANWLTVYEHGHDIQADRLADHVAKVWQALEQGAGLTPELNLYRRGIGRLKQVLAELVEAGRIHQQMVAIRSLGRAIGRLLPSYMHMMNNRLGITVQEESYLALLIEKALSYKTPTVETPTLETPTLGPIRRNLIA